MVQCLSRVGRGGVRGGRRSPSTIRRYEAGTSTPTLDALRKLAIALSVGADTLVFDNDERGPEDDPRIRFEATARLSDEEKQTVRLVLEGLLLAYDVKHDANAGPPDPQPSAQASSAAEVSSSPTGRSAS